MIVLLIILAGICGVIFSNFYPIWPDIKFVVLYLCQMINAINPSILIVERFISKKYNFAKSNRIYNLLNYQEQHALLLLLVFVTTAVMIAFYEFFPTYVVTGFFSFQILWTLSLLRIK